MATHAPEPLDVAAVGTGHGRPSLNRDIRNCLDRGHGALIPLWAGKHVLSEKPTAASSRLKEG